MVITIPLNTNKGKILVKEGDFVDFNTPILERNEVKNKILNVAKILKIKPDKIFNYLKKFVGEEVKKNEIIAEKKDFFSHKKILSEEDGLITNINHETGEIIIEYQDKQTSKKIFSFFTGKIEKIEKEIITLKVKKKISFPTKNSSNNFGGKVFYFSHEVNFFSLKEEEVKDKIIVIKSINPFVQTKLEALGVKGFIVLTKLEKAPLTDFAIIKNIGDYEKILMMKYSTCLNLKIDDKIYFYE